jgi:hypothetical protein
MPITIAAPDDMNWIYGEPDDAVRVDFDAWPLLERAGLSVEEAEQDPKRFVAVLEDLLGEDAQPELRSPGPHVGPDAGDWVRSFLDVVVMTGGVAAAAESAVRITRKLRKFNPRAYVSKKGIEVLARQQLRFHGHPEDSLLVVIEFIAIPDTSGLTGVPPTLDGHVAVFRLADGRLVTMRWSLDAVLEDYSEGGTPYPTAQ